MPTGTEPVSPSRRGRWRLILSVANCLVVSHAALSCEPEAAAPPAFATKEKNSATVASDCPYISTDQLASLRRSARLVVARAAVVKPSVQIVEAVSVDAATPTPDIQAAIVIGSGWNAEAEQRVCSELSTKGFARVTVLRGGARAWVRAGLPIWADAGGGLSLDVASPAEAHAAAVRGDARLIVLPANDQPILCPSDVANMHCVSSYRLALKRLRQRDPNQTAMLSASDHDFARIRHALRGDNKTGLMRVAGGPEAMQQHFANYQSIAQSASQVLWIPCHRR